LAIFRPFHSADFSNF
jgi:hypothetical protein